MTNTWRDLQEKMRTDSAEDFLRNVAANNIPKFPEDVRVNITLSLASK